ncbi:GtrA family protein [Pedobacter sp. ASV28]|jgi:putative flippase GtrA|uniref:GtrA family protein n=1 Tax=Pedobacter sp. ASV28 TaxID=2795123 RepID=UPI0018EE01A6|nr:GtrA family protein [Pedobacter sp. ASV28]
MLTFLKAQASSLTATLVDYLITWFCVDMLGLWYVLGSIKGTVVGGCVNFYMGRNWVFNSTDKDIKLQILKYILVWCGNLVLITAGVYLLTHYLGFNYMLSKILVSGLIGTIYNYFMQKQFIFIQ